MKIKIPSFIKTGDTIAIAAPSFGCTTEPYSTRLISAVEKLKKRGYKIKIGDCVFKSDGKGISTDPETAAKELMNFYLDDKIDAIISAGGGELMCETVSYIDFKKLKKASPKLFMGYSDNTNFIFPLVTIAGKAAIYGPCIGGFGKEWEECEKDSISLLEGKKTTFCGYEKFQLPENDGENGPLGKYMLTEKKELKLFNCENGTSFDGILLGGCLDVLTGLCGTSLDNMKTFNRKNKKIIWILESCDGNPCEIRRQMWHLKQAGWFEKASGFIIGKPLSAFNQEMMGIDQYNAVTDIIKDLKLPVIMDADIGHIDPSMPVLMGAEAAVKIGKNNFSIDIKIS